LQPRDALHEANMSEMTHLFPACAGVLWLAVTTVTAAAATVAAVPASAFTLSSPDPQLRQHLPDIYAANAFGCSGGNTSPPLVWRNPPAGTKSFVNGPCPAKGDPPHRYIFTIYALSVATLPVDAGAPAAMVTSTAQDSLLGKAVFVVHHGR
jgi:phosphatidylethanolamine-binding protein (PEBP) family uncharacterized protein